VTIWDYKPGVNVVFLKWSMVVQWQKKPNTYHQFYHQYSLEPDMIEDGPESSYSRG
jgi:hypothetical protein